MFGVDMGEEEEGTPKRGAGRPKGVASKGVLLKLSPDLAAQLQSEATALGLPLATHIKSILQQRENERRAKLGQGDSNRAGE